MKALCEKYGLPYNTGPLHRQLGSVAKKTCRLALPTRKSQDPAPVTELGKAA